jgi:hypothetical protein
LAQRTADVSDGHFRDRNAISKTHLLRPSSTRVARKGLCSICGPDHGKASVVGRLRRPKLTYPAARSPRSLFYKPARHAVNSHGDLPERDIAASIAISGTPKASARDTTALSHDKAEAPAPPSEMAVTLALTPLRAKGHSSAASGAPASGAAPWCRFRPRSSGEPRSTFLPSASSRP